MLKIRLKRLGAKKAPTYRIIVINSTTKREGRPIEELGHYNPKTKVMQFDKAKAEEWISKGAQPTETVAYLMKNCNADGTLNYKKKDGVKLSKKAQAKAKAEAEAKAQAEAEAKAAAEAEAKAKAEAEAAAKAEAEAAAKAEAEAPAEEATAEAPAEVAEEAPAEASAEETPAE